MRHQVSEKIGPWVNDAIDKHALGEKILWEPQLMPGQQGEAMLVCFFWMPGAIVGSTMQGSFALLDPLHTEAKDIDETVAEFLSQMRAARSQSLEEEPEAPSAPVLPLRANQTASGLLLPT